MNYDDWKTTEPELGEECSRHRGHAADDCDECEDEHEQAAAREVA